ncbi:dienelactone hydrolase family protein [Colwellia sp. MB02u-10]|uniref:alpha/beta hydrolase family protein n=1 Tax=Colwellia sp. MB02u-10 TaxID=2759828 RepID=UPI0015F5EE32|nr:dienelactone hydrolase family protein [Colwellia sp. MB02u-10]MBA6340420.1 dienelactone hydrolase family protein [Colwellia sp. MB02u-10]
MRVKNKKTLIISTLLCCYLQFSHTVLANTPSNTQLTLVPEQLYSPLPSDVVPELASLGKFKVGVKTIEIVNPDQFDAATQTTKDRKLVVEVWYPSNTTSTSIKTSYENETRTGIEFSLQANAYRDAVVLSPNDDTKFPLVVISHGYTGYSTIMFYLAEHLASHGYIVAAIDHTDSTNADVDFNINPVSGFFSTLLNRSRDQQFTLNYLTKMTHFASAAIDNNKAGLVGYSMGGFGAINTIGACYNFTPATASAFTGLKDPEQVQKVMSLLNSCAGGQYKNASVDHKWQAVVAMAPWGGQHNLFKQEAMAKMNTPILYVGGSLDDISGYDGIKSLYEKTGSKDKYLLTYQNARHNIAPHPAPSVSKISEIDIGHYYEASWDSLVLNNTNKHFTLAMMDCYLKQQLDQCEYLDLSSSSNQVAVDGKTPKPWKGFDHRYSTGMNWHMSK